MVTIAAFLRHSPKPLLIDYFTRIGAGAEAAAVWNAHPQQATSKLIEMIQQLDEARQIRAFSDSERICALSDEAGETAIYAVSESPEHLDSLPSRHARALWTFLEQPKVFEHAEQSRHADARRNGRMWDGFVGQRGLEVARAGPALEGFQSVVAKAFESKRVFVEICDRSRPGQNKEILVQATIYVEGRANEVLAFVGSTLSRLSSRAVIEAAITYVPATGTIEVVAPTGGTREALAKLFAEHLLLSPVSGARIPLRKFTLDGLRKPHSFPSDPEDQIETVRVNRLRLMPLDTQSERITLECVGAQTKTIWQAASDRFSHHDPLKSGCLITQAHLTIRFLPKPGVRGRTLSITITAPAGCDLKDRTHRERVVGQKYLVRWGLLSDV